MAMIGGMLPGITEQNKDYLIHNFILTQLKRNLWQITSIDFFFESTLIKTVQLSSQLGWQGHGGS